MSAICTGTIEYLKETINSDQFIKQHRQNPTDFLRFNADIFLTNPVKESYQRSVYGWKRGLNRIAGRGRKQ